MVTVHLRWRDSSGALRRQTLQLTPGNHDIYLTTTAQESQSR